MASDPRRTPKSPHTCECESPATAPYSGRAQQRRATDGSSPGRSAACRRTACRPYRIHALGGCAGGAPGGRGLGSRMAGNLGIPGGDCRSRGGRSDCARGGGAATLSAVVDSWPGHRRAARRWPRRMCTACGMDLSRRWRRTGRSCRPSWRFVLTLIGWPGRDRGLAPPS